MTSSNVKGYIYGLTTSITFGLIPLFTLPLMKEGMTYGSILFYRFLFATAALGIMMKIKKEKFAINKNEIAFLVILGLLYTGSAMFLFWGYGVMGAGIATTIHFTYPVFVTLIMLAFFKEKPTWVTWSAIILAVLGVAKLSINGEGMNIDIYGVLIVIISAICYATYITIVNKSRMKNMGSRKLAFYVFIVSTILFAVKASCNEGIQDIPDIMSTTNLILLAIVPTVVSNITLVMAVRNIGGTKTSILGAMEPVTAVCIGAFLFGENITAGDAVGIAMILVAVTMIIMTNTIKNTISNVVKRIRPRHA